MKPSAPSLNRAWPYAVLGLIVLASLAGSRPDIDQLLATAAELGPLPVEHTADALRYRITTLIRKEDEMARHEALAMTRRPLPPPPTSHRPDPGRSRGISI